MKKGWLKMGDDIIAPKTTFDQVVDANGNTFLNDVERKSNKVTSWSSTTTDEHFPSEKLVKNALDGKANTSHGYHAPTPESPNNSRFLRNDNTWQYVTPGNIGAAASGHNHDGVYLKKYIEEEISGNEKTNNPQGGYVKFTNGLMVAWNRTTLGDRSPHSVGLFAAFKDTNYSCHIGSTARTTRSIQPESTSSVSVRHESGDTYTYFILCIGWWK